jgi:hypothetical protein
MDAAAAVEREDPDDDVLDGEEEDLAAAGLEPASVEEDRLKCEIARLINAGDKLRYSNEELEAALVDAPGDEDFTLAVQENNEVLVGFAKQITKMQKELEVLLEASGAAPVPQMDEQGGLSL